MELLIWLLRENVFLTIHFREKAILRGIFKMVYQPKKKRLAGRLDLFDTIFTPQSMEFAFWINIKICFYIEFYDWFLAKSPVIRCHTKRVFNLAITVCSSNKVTSPYKMIFMPLLFFLFFSSKSYGLTTDVMYSKVINIDLQSWISSRPITLENVRWVRRILAHLHKIKFCKLSKIFFFVSKWLTSNKLKHCFIKKHCIKIIKKMKLLIRN